MLRNEKRRALKRKRKEEGQDVDEEGKDKVKEIEIDRDQIVSNYENGNYDLSVHFSKKLGFEINEKSKIRSIFVVPSSTKKSKTLIKFFISMHSN